MANSLIPPQNLESPILATVSSLIIPGLGQALQKKYQRGIFILTFGIILASLIYWSTATLKLGLISLGTIQVSWLWIPFGLYWLWNVLDANAIGMKKTTGILAGIIFAFIIIYVIAWNVTEVKLYRLVERFNDARMVSVKLLNPDIFTISINGEDSICDWGCLYTYLEDKISGHQPAGVVRISDNVFDIFGRIKPQPAPGWRVSLGLAAEGSRVDTFVAGTLVETIAMGLMATLLSTLFAIPISFLAAQNIMSRVPGGGDCVLYRSHTIEYCPGN